MEKKLLYGLIAVATVLGSICVALICTLIGVSSRAKLYSTSLENFYKRSLYELVSNVNDVELDISKVISTTSTKSQKEILYRISDKSSCAGENLAYLPVAKKDSASFFDILNHISGYTRSLCENLDSGGSLSSENISTLSSLHDTALNLVFTLNDYLLSLDFDYEIINDVDFRSDLEAGYTGGLDNIEDEQKGMPTLIYDGPFSESVVNKEVVGLPEGEISATDAEEVIKSKLAVYDVKGIKYEGDSDGKIYTYNFSVICAKCTLFVQVTKQGGCILSLDAMSYDAPRNELNNEEIKTGAINVATILGLEDMTCVWQSTDGSISYLNLAPNIKNVIYYPDLVKVKVDRIMGLVIGVDATNYYTNHVERTLSSPSIDLATAKGKVAKTLEVIDSNLALIPDKYVGETLTYEFVCTWKDYTYYVYIDSKTGDEANIMRVVKTTRGDLIV